MLPAGKGGRRHAAGRPWVVSQPLQGALLGPGQVVDAAGGGAGGDGLPAELVVPGAGQGGAGDGDLLMARYRVAEPGSCRISRLPSAS